MTELPAAADVRAVLREHGEPVNERGRLSEEEKAAYRRIQGGGAEPDAPAGDYDAGVTEADFPAGEQEETRPRKPPKPPRSSFRDRLRPKPGKAKSKRLPRIPVDRLCEHAWDFLARAAGTIDPPVGRCLSMQAPVAGLVLEDTVRGTAVDRALQPLARAEERAQKVAALVGPPVLVAALEAAQGLPEDKRKMREAMLVPLLRESMVLWVRIAGDKVEEKAKRDAEYGPVYEQVDTLLAMIFAPPAGGPGTSPEDEQAARAQQMAGV